MSGQAFHFNKFLVFHIQDWSGCRGLRRPHTQQGPPINTESS